MEENNAMKISRMSAITTVTDEVMIPVVTGGANRHMTVAQLRAAIGGKSDWTGTQIEYNALASHDADRWYTVTLDGEVAALYRGDKLVHALPNMVGEFDEDSLPEDWYWFPNNVKTPLPVDPATKRFSFYYPDRITNSVRLFAGGEAASLPDFCRIKRLERMPALYRGNPFYAVGLMGLCELLPTIDGAGLNGAMSYLLLSSPHVTQLHLKNTGNVTDFSMTVNQAGVRRIDGVDLSSAVKIADVPFNATTAYIGIRNLGKAQGLKTANLWSRNWGDDTMVRGARQSLVDALLTYSHDRVTAGWAAVTVTLSTATFQRLTADEVAAITAKGYTIVTSDTLVLG